MILNCVQHRGVVAGNRRGNLVFVVVRYKREADHYTPSSGETENVPLLNTSSRRGT